MAWEIRAKCEQCEYTLPSFGPYRADSRVADKRLDLSDLREAMREHEVNEHGGKS